MGRYWWSDPEAALKDILADKEEGSRRLRDCKNDEAYGRWGVALSHIKRASASRSLLRQGGKPFLSQLAGLYFVMVLNRADVVIAKMENPDSLTSARDSADRELIHAAMSMNPDHWVQNYTYTPSNELLAWFNYQRARFLRLEGKHVGASLMYIDTALSLLPDDTAILEEKGKIEELHHAQNWRFSIRERLTYVLI